MPGSNVPDARGRPRDKGLDRAILTAALDLLAEVGYTEVTVAGIARRAGVGKPTIYLRWAHKAALISTAVATAMTPAPFPDTGDLRSDLVVGVRTTLRGLSSSHAGTVLPGLLADLRNDAELAGSFREHYFEPRWASLRSVINRSVDAGTLPEDLDLELATDILMGPIYYRLLVDGAPHPPFRAEALVDAALAAWQSGAFRVRGG